MISSILEHSLTQPHYKNQTQINLHECVQSINYTSHNLFPRISLEYFGVVCCGRMPAEIDSPVPNRLYIQTNLQEHVQDIKYTSHNLTAPTSLKCSLYPDIMDESIGPLDYRSN